MHAFARSYSSSCSSTSAQLQGPTRLTTHALRLALGALGGLLALQVEASQPNPVMTGYVSVHPLALGTSLHYKLGDMGLWSIQSKSAPNLGRCAM